MCFAFLPTHQVVIAFEAITDDEDTPSAFISYFESTYIGVKRGRGLRQRRGQPTLLIEIWNVLSRVNNHLPGSNNSLEGFHSTLKSSITSIHPILSNLIDAIKEELSISETKDLHRLRGDYVQQKNMHQLLTRKIKK